jgi:hypothetical protein
MQHVLPTIINSMHSPYQDNFICWTVHTTQGKEFHTSEPTRNNNREVIAIHLVYTNIHTVRIRLSSLHHQFRYNKIFTKILLVPEWNGELFFLSIYLFTKGCTASQIQENLHKDFISSQAKAGNYYLSFFFSFFSQGLHRQSEIQEPYVNRDKAAYGIWISVGRMQSCKCYNATVFWWKKKSWRQWYNDLLSFFYAKTRGPVRVERKRQNAESWMGSPGNIKYVSSRSTSSYHCISSVRWNEWRTLERERNTKATYPN